MATRTEKVAPDYIHRMGVLRDKLADTQAYAAKLLAEYMQAGGATMGGIDAFDFTAYGLTDKNDFTGAFGQLNNSMTGVVLTELLTGGKWNKVIIMASGIANT